MMTYFTTHVRSSAAGWLLHLASEGGLLLVLLSGWGFYLCSRHELKWLRNRHLEEIACQQEAAAIRRGHAAAQSRLHAVQASVRELHGRLPATADTANFLSEISDLASASQITIRSFQPSQTLVPTPQGGWSGRDITLDCEGDYAALCHFLADLPKTDAMCQVTSFTVSSAGNTGRCQIELQLRLYSQPKPTSLPKRI